MHGPEIGTKFQVKLTGLNLRGVLDRGPTSPIELSCGSGVSQNIDGQCANEQGNHLDRRYEATSARKQTPKHPHEDGCPRIPRDRVHAFRPLRFGTGHLLAYNSTPRVRAVFQMISIDRLIYPLVIQAAAHWQERLAEFTSMCGHFVLFLVGCSAPHLDQGQVIGPVALLQ
jgi:hypothetical protein